MDTTDTLSIIAIVIASIAFFVAFSQVLQQYYATAEGYRRCQYSVMGQWSGFTYRKFRWSEFRFETRFTTPHIRIGVKLGNEFKLEIGQIPLLLTSVEADKKAQADARATESEVAEWAGWVQLVKDIQTLQTKTINKFPQHAPALQSRLNEITSGKTMPFPKLTFSRNRDSSNQIFPTTVGTQIAVAHSMRDLCAPTTLAPPSDVLQGVSDLQYLELASCSLRHQSWDFMPPDVIKPLAMIWVCDLAILAIRLGLRWLEFKPNEGILRAEGNGLVLTSMQLRSIGCAISIQRYAEPNLSSNQLLIPTRAASSMAFGKFPILTVPYPTATPGFAERSPSDLAWSNPECLDLIQKLRSQGRPLYALVDIISLVAPFMRQWNSHIVCIPAPFHKPYSIMRSETCRLAFATELQKLEKELMYPATNVSGTAVEQLKTIAQRYRDLLSRDDPLSTTLFLSFDHFETAKHNGMPVHFLKHLHEQATSASIWLSQGFCSDGKTWNGNLFPSFQVIQLKHSILAYEEAEKNVADGKEQRYDSADLMHSCNKWDAVFAEATRLWFLRLGLMHEEFKAELKRRQVFSDSDLHVTFSDFAAIWVTIMFRGFCWGCCHYMVEGTSVGPEYDGSKIPIYIT